MPAVFPYLYILRIFWALGVGCVTTAPLLADYVSKTSKPMSGALIGLVSGLGALFHVYCFTKITKLLHDNEVKSTYYYVVVFAIAMAGVICITVSNRYKQVHLRQRTMFIFN